jgi:hypothetical protein
MARYSDSLLTEGENVVYRARQHWLALFIRGRSSLGLLIVGILLIGLVLFAKNLFPDNTLQQTLTSGVGLVLLLVGVAILIYRWWQWSNQDYLITNRRLLKVTGILNKHSADSSLEKINDAILDQPVLGRMMNYGDLTILTAAEEAVDRYHLLNNPKEFKKAMLTQKHALETEFMYQGAMPPTPPLRAEQMQPAPPPMAAQPAPPPTAPPPAMPAATDVAAAETPGIDMSHVAPAVATAGMTSANDPSLDVTQTLARLADLRDSGAITPEEYESKKQELLGRL